MFLVCAPLDTRADLSQQIAEMERHLIQEALRKNPDLSNRKNRQVPLWGISGFLRSNPGGLSSGAREFRRLMTSA
jgi:hypothetical protein